MKKPIKITRGMANVMGRGQVARQCAECGLAVPKYRGPYPAKCPSCGGAFEAPQTEGTESHLGLIDAALNKLASLLG